jgi:hypothetical protein
MSILLRVIGLVFVLTLLVIVFMLLLPAKKNPTEEFVISPTVISLKSIDPSSDDEDTSLVRKKLSFDVSPSVYLTTSFNVLVPTSTCCDTLFNIVHSNLPDNSFFISTDQQQYLDIVFIDLKGPATFFSVQLVPYQGVKRGWFMETMSGYTRLYQLVEGIGKIYLGLSLDRTTIQGYNLDKGIYASVNVVLTS